MTESMQSPTNMRILRPSRAKRKPGEIFVFQMPDGFYRYGRLVSNSAKIGPMENVCLVYIYQVKSKTKTPVPTLSPAMLLTPPFMTNQKPWSLGYFEVVEHHPLATDDVLPAHCFKDSRNRYFDDKNKELKTPTIPCGQYGLNSYRTIDDLLSKELGFPLVPDNNVTPNNSLQPTSALTRRRV